MGPGGERGRGGAPGPPSRRIARLAPLLVLALVASSVGAPAASAAHGDTGVSLQPWVRDCPKAWMGFHGGRSFLEYHACFTFNARAPSYGAEEFTRSRVPPNVTVEDCPGSFDGRIVSRFETSVGVCADVRHRVPTELQNFDDVDVRTSPCRLPNDDQRAEDPVILVADGGVAVCVIPVVDPGREAPGFGVDTEPCEPRSVDPEVHAAGGGVEVCLRFEVLGFGSEEVEMLRRIAEDTLAFVFDLTPFG